VVLIRDRDGDARRNPALLAPRQYAEETRRWMVELGLTASARDSLQASMPASGLPGERLLTGR
jgi:hypothetical protein